MKKVLMMILVGILSVSVLTGCSKNEEEKTSYEQMKEDVQSELAENEELKEEAAATEAELDEKWRSQLENAYLSYDNSTDPTEIIEFAESYNSIFREMTIDVEASGFKAKNCSEISDFFTNVSGISVEIPELEYNTKSLYYKSVVGQEYEKFICYFNKEKNSSLFVLTNSNPNTGLLSEIKIIKSDGETLEFSVSDFEKNDYTNIGIYSVTENNLVFWTNFNSDSYYYEVDISGNTPTLNTSGQGGCEDYEQEYKSAESSIDDGFNSLIYKLRTY